MKNFILTMVAVLAISFANAQEKKESLGSQTSKGKWLVEVNTGFGAGVGSTGFYLSTSDGSATAYNIGAEAGFFVMDNLAIKAGLGYGDDGYDFTAFAYKIGAKYYVKGMIPVEVSYNGASVTGEDVDASYIGIQGGYALFIGNNLSIEPGLRYNLSMDKDNYDDVLQFNIGFALHF
jgi:hypothetical protein